MRPMRVRRRVAQTPVARYQNRRTGRTVTIIANVHLGTSEYFARLDQIAAGLEARGAVVCYEGIRPAAEEDWAHASDRERAVRGMPEAEADRRRRELCRSLGWVEQNAGLRYRPSWRNVDVTDLDFVRQAEADNVSTVFAGSDDLYAGLTPEQRRLVMASMVSVLLRLESLDYWNLIVRWTTRKVSGDAYQAVFRAAVLDRNRDALARLPSDADAVLLWGGGHLSGLAKGLRKAGYRHRGTTWVPIGELPALWPSFRIALSWLRSPGPDDGGQSR
jgi:hypothetical protein